MSASQNQKNCRSSNSISFISRLRVLSSTASPIFTLFLCELSEMGELCDYSLPIVAPLFLYFFSLINAPIAAIAVPELLALAVVFRLDSPPSPPG